MKWVAGAVLSSLAIAAPCQAGVIGWLDYVDVEMYDNAVGWVCENEDAVNTPSYGVIDLYINGGPGTGGYLYGSADLHPSNNAWGYYKAGVNAAGYCGTDSYVGFSFVGWFDDPRTQGTNTIYMYFRDNNGNSTQLGGGITPTHVGQNY
jgi:hypothetical protein